MQELHWCWYHMIMDTLLSCLLIPDYLLPDLRILPSRAWSSLPDDPASAGYVTGPFCNMLVCSQQNSAIPGSWRACTEKVRPLKTPISELSGSNMWNNGFFLPGCACTTADWHLDLEGPVWGFRAVLNLGVISGLTCSKADKHM